MREARNEKKMYDETDLHGAFSDAEHTKPLAKAPNAQDYIEDLKGEGYDSLSTSEKVELLESLFIIMKSFVNLGHGLDPVNKLIEEFEISSEEPPLMIDCEDATDGEE